MRATVPTAGVLSDPGAQIVRFPDIDHGAGLIRELIDAGTGWQGCQLGFESGMTGERVNVAGFFVRLEDRLPLYGIRHTNPQKRRATPKAVLTTVFSGAAIPSQVPAVMRKHTRSALHTCQYVMQEEPGCVDRAGETR